MRIADLTDACSAGTPWNTWERVEAFDYNEQRGLGTNLGTNSWPAWMSTNYTHAGTGDPTLPGNGPIWRWGNPEQGACTFGPCQLEDGPTGPPEKGVWDPNVFQ